jgi:hypothetical protein
MGPEPGVRSQNAVVAVAMNARRRDELGEGLEELEGREEQLGAAVDIGFGEAVEKAALGCREGGGGVRRSVVRIARKKIWSTAPATRMSWWR